MRKPEQTIFVVDDDEAVRDALKLLLGASGLRVEACPSAAAFLKSYTLGDSGCLVLDIRMPGMSGLALQDELISRRIALPIIFLTGHADVPIAVQAMKRGAFDFIEKPLDSQRLIQSVDSALAYVRQQRKTHVAPDGRNDELDARLAQLSLREREVLDMVLEGKQTRLIAEVLGISIKTVEFHRARIREKLNVGSLGELFQLFRTR